MLFSGFSSPLSKELWQILQAVCWDDMVM